MPSPPTPSLTSTEPRYSGSRARVWSAPVVGQQQMWAQQLRALESLAAYAGGGAFTAAVSLRVDLFSPISP